MSGSRAHPQHVVGGAARRIEAVGQFAAHLTSLGLMTCSWTAAFSVSKPAMYTPGTASTDPGLEWLWRSWMEPLPTSPPCNTAKVLLMAGIHPGICPMNRVMCSSVRHTAGWPA